MKTLFDQTIAEIEAIHNSGELTYSKLEKLDQLLELRDWLAARLEQVA